MTITRRAAVGGLVATGALAGFVRRAQAANYSVTLRNPNTGEEHVLSVSADDIIQDAAEEAGVQLPATCYAGACSTCAAKLVSGTVDQDDQSFLGDSEIAQGYVVLCVALATSDVVLETHQEAALMAYLKANDPFYR